MLNVLPFILPTALENLSSFEWTSGHLGLYRGGCSGFAGVRGWGGSTFPDHYQAHCDVMYPELAITYLRNDIGHTHNDLLNFAAYFGIPAAICYGLFLLTMSMVGGTGFLSKQSAGLAILVLTGFLGVVGLARTICFLYQCYVHDFVCLRVVSCVAEGPGAGTERRAETGAGFGPAWLCGLLHPLTTGRTNLRR